MLSLLLHLPWKFAASFSQWKELLFLSSVAKAPHSLTVQFGSSPSLPPSLPPIDRCTCTFHPRRRRRRWPRGSSRRAAKSTEFVFSMLSGLLLPSFLARQIRLCSAPRTRACVHSHSPDLRAAADDRRAILGVEPFARPPAPNGPRPPGDPGDVRTVAGNRRRHHRGGEFLRSGGARETSRQRDFFSRRCEGSLFCA